MLISQSEAAKRVNVSRQAVQKWKQENPLPEFFVDPDGNGRLKIDDQHPEWAALEARKNATTIERKVANKNRSTSQKVSKQIRGKVKKPAAKPQVKREFSPPQKQEPLTDEQIKKIAESETLVEEVNEAAARAIIYKSKIAEEQAKQAEIKTNEMKAGLAPIDLLKHFFSFAENLIQRIGRRPYEISPEISALYMAGNDKKAIDKMVRELESIIKTCVKELLEDVRKEGFRIEKELEKHAGKGKAE